MHWWSTWFLLWFTRFLQGKDTWKSQMEPTSLQSLPFPDFDLLQCQHLHHSNWLWSNIQFQKEARWQSSWHQQHYQKTEEEQELGDNEVQHDQLDLGHHLHPPCNDLDPLQILNLTLHSGHLLWNSSSLLHGYWGEQKYGQGVFQIEHENFSKEKQNRNSHHGEQHNWDK